MKSMSSANQTLCVIILALLLCHCTSSPVGDSATASQNREVRGAVSLSNQNDPQTVFIWFDGLEMSKRPDQFGRFQFTLPPPAAQTPAGGLDGAFKVYFYIANFNFASKVAIIRNGFFVYGAGDIDESGEFSPSIFLNEQLVIRTRIEPHQITLESDTLSFSAEVFLQSFKDTVDVLYPREVDEVSAPLLFKNLATEDVEIVPTTITSIDTTDFKRISTKLFSRKMDVKLAANEFEAGLYEIVPYLLVVNNDVPAQVIERIGDNVEALGPNYLELPFIRREGELEILADSDDSKP
ncbi:hypothetical protein GWO43_18100 [candidate division KSB1 bacterium]|nr:hypothetical protein [candidate division KSB1 bacterium]NIR69972.1 hypothetical protein [candidate division KSB1 bacterium]NIS25871.1 hypothetical protein [candidate division KSB1 bacterium]NIT72748.1 hypothetical protein [candidate division KSB1 bacterium]NIU26560.1 hypothetical protein [candidate division KSB1 bacterium]